MLARNLHPVICLAAAAMTSLLLAAPTTAQAKTYDDFNGGNAVSEVLWNWEDELKTVSQSKGLLHIAGPPLGKYNNLGSTHGFRGNFEFVLDFRNFKATATKFTSNDPTIWLEVQAEATRGRDFIFIGRSLGSQGHQMYSGGKLNNVWQNGTSAKVSATSGQLRITRKGSTISTSYKIGSSFVVQKTFKTAFSGIVRVQIGNYSGDNGTFAVDSDFITYNQAELIPPPQLYGNACHGIGIFEGSFATLGNKNFGVGVDGAPASANLWFLLGVSKLSLHLAPMGAPNCYLNSSMDFLLAGLRADKNGEYLLPAPIPQDPKIVGATLFCQWAAESRKANAWGLIWSDGLAVKILK